LSKVAPKSAPAQENGCLRLFFLPFFLLSSGFLYALTLRPVLQMAEARHWAETPCVIDSSEVGYHPGDDSGSYSIDITYHYTSAGQPYTSKRYDFAFTSSPGLKRKQVIVDRYKPGAATVCFVSPAAPAEAVLDRGWRPEMGRMSAKLSPRAAVSSVRNTGRQRAARVYWRRSPPEPGNRQSRSRREPVR